MILGGLLAGGGINSDNSLSYIEEGAGHVIVTSYVFNNGQRDLERLKDLVRVVGKQRLVLDISCRKKNGKYAIVTDRWQKFSDVYTLMRGLGIDEELVTLLGMHSPIPVTYAGGVTTLAHLEKIKVAGMGRVDVTVMFLAATWLTKMFLLGIMPSTMGPWRISPLAFALFFAVYLALEGYFSATIF